MDNIQQLDHMKLLTDMTEQATELAAALQEERDQSAGPLAARRQGERLDVNGARDKTDRAASRPSVDAAEAIDNATARRRSAVCATAWSAIAGQLGNLSEIREHARTPGRPATRPDRRAYNRLITSLLDLSQDMAQATSNPEMIKRTRALAAFSSAKEYASDPARGDQRRAAPPRRQLGTSPTTDRQYGQPRSRARHRARRSFSRSTAGERRGPAASRIDGGNDTITEADDHAPSASLRSPDGIQSIQSARTWTGTTTPRPRSRR